VKHQGLPEIPPAKKFKSKHNLPVLDSYRSNAPDWYWDLFPNNKVGSSSSLIDGKKLEAMAIDNGYPDLDHLSKVVDWLENGADIGCKGEFRNSSTANNSSSAYEDGEKVSDAIADWTMKKFAFGPVPIAEVPIDAKVSSIMTRAKPNGAVRVILNLSSPEGKSVNEGIDNTDYPAKMSSTAEWLRVLQGVGRYCKITKIDFSDAYKHIAVRDQDTDLQWFVWLGKAFKELCLIFGSASSAGIFDAVAKIILFIVLKRANFNKDWVIQHLDDICGAAPENSDMLETFDNMFVTVANELGVKLAPREDLVKSFGPSTHGIVLGIEYDTVSWTWGVPEEKLARLLHSIEEAIAATHLKQQQIWSLVGKILNIKPLIPGAKFNIDHLIRANNVSKKGSDLIAISGSMKDQLYFWRLVLPLCSGNIPIPNKSLQVAPWVMETYTDAAGGSVRSSWHGVGAIASNWWSYLMWGKKINIGAPCSDGRKLDSVMSALELVGPLLIVSAGHKWCKLNQVRVWVDNMASVSIYKKGYSSSCRLSTTLVKAMSTVAVGIGCRLEIEKITRCSTPMASMADALSKGKFMKFRQIASANNLEMPLDMARVPLALKQWIVNPLEDDHLGHKILLELSQNTNVLSYNY
jgi:hypothetical protein